MLASLLPLVRAGCRRPDPRPALAQTAPLDPDTAVATAPVATRSPPAHTTRLPGTGAASSASLVCRASSLRRPTLGSFGSHTSPTAAHWVRAVASCSLIRYHGSSQGTPFGCRLIF